MNQRKTVLVLGAYGIAGRAVSRGLLEKTESRVLGAGRRSEKLEALASRLDSERFEIRLLDTEDPGRLAELCAEADLVVNCVGPYPMGGAELARRVLRTGRPYIDCANEQVHYRRLRELDGEARERGLMLVTAAGQTPGISTFMLLHAASRVERPEHLEMVCAQGRLPDEEAGFGSVMGALLEAGFGAETFEGGGLRPVPLGKDRGKEELPAPFGEVPVLGVPLIDSLLVPPRVPGLQSLRTCFSVGVAPPWGTFAFLRLIQPHRFSWSYRLLSWITRGVMRRDFQRAAAAGFDSGGFMRFTARGASDCWQALLPFSDGGTVTSFLPVLLARRFLRGELEAEGLVTPIDLLSFEELTRELGELGWGLEIRESPSV